MTTKPRTTKPTAIWNRAIKAAKPDINVIPADETDSARAARIAVFSGASEGLRSVLAHQRKARVPVAQAAPGERGAPEITPKAPPHSSRRVTK